MFMTVDNNDRILNEFYATLRSVHSPIVKYLNAGLNRNEIEAKIKLLNLSFPEEAYTFYKYKNGINLEMAQKEFIEIWIVPLGTIISLENAINRYSNLAGKIQGWKKSMFPIFESTGGDFYLLDCEKDSPNYGFVYYYLPTNVDFEFSISAFDSLGCFLETITACWKKGIFFYNSEGFFEYDFKNYIGVASLKNKNSEYWKIYKYL